MFKDILGFEGYYQVDENGNVRTVPRYVSNHTGKLYVKERILKQRYSKKGYKVVDLSINAKKFYRQVHRLVAMTFIPNPDNKPQVNHINEIKDDNRVENLEWVTNLENQRHARKNGLVWRWDNSGRKKKSIYKIDIKTNEIIEEYPSIVEAARQNKLNKANIITVCSGKRKPLWWI